MKKLIVALFILVISLKTNAQKESSIIIVVEDTIRIGSLVIVKSQDSSHKKNWQSLVENGDFEHTKIRIGKIRSEKKPQKLQNKSTNWFVFDLGYTNFRDESPALTRAAVNQNPTSLLPGTFAPSVLELNNRKSSNFNLWIVQQKVNLYKHKLNLKYGVGFEMFNFRLDQPISFRDNIPGYITFENIKFSKNKLFTKYLTVPFQLNFQPNPTNKKSFYASVGMSAGYLIDARNKQISTERGKQKYDGNFNLNNWRVATIGELGIGGIRLFGSYGLTNLFQDNTTSFKIYPYSIGLRFSNF